MATTIFGAGPRNPIAAARTSGGSITAAASTP
jgi:hypothetical protein